MSKALAQEEVNPGASLTSGPILGTMLAFSASTLLSNLLSTINQSISLIWIGRLLGEGAIAAVTNGSQTMGLLGTVMLGFAMATMIRIAHHFGADSRDDLRRAFACGVGWTIGLGAMIAIAGALLAPTLLHLLGAPPETLGMAVPYLRVLFFTLPVTALSGMFAMSARGAGQARVPLNGTFAIIGTAVWLNPLLILGFGPIPPLGLTGAALASGLANLAGVLVMAVQLWRKNSPLRLTGADLRWLMPRGTEIAFLLRNGVPIAMHMVLIVGAQVVMIGLVNREGLNFTAAFGVNLQIWGYLQMPSFAISAGITAMAAQAIGAGDHARVDAVRKVGIVVNTGLAVFLAVTILVLSRPLLGMFLGHASPAIPIGVHMQTICIWAFVLTSTTSALTAVLRAYGTQILALVVNLISLYLARLGFFFATYPLLGADALWWSFLFGAAISVLLTHIAVRRGWGQSGAPAIDPDSVTLT